MNYLVYQTTNNTNNKIYIGMHQTTDIHDGYLGSGKILKRAIEKYGTENFSREILHRCDSAEEMKSLEEKIVDEDFVLRQDTYNLKVGGEGGGVKGRVTSEEQKEKLRQKMIGRNLGKTYDEIYGKEIAKAKRLKCSQAQLGQLSPLKERNYETIYGAEEAEKQRQKRSDAHRGKVLSKEHKINLSIRKKGKPDIKVTCPSCDKVGGVRIMKRWHFDNCKQLKEGNK